MDYEDSGLKEDSLWQVLDSFQYDKGVDKFLFTHVKEMAKKLKYDKNPNLILAKALFEA